MAGTEPARPYPVRRVEQVSVTRTVTLYGDGTARAPYREIVQWWYEGKELARSDPWADELRNGDRVRTFSFTGPL